jgi:(p)ppGpp synthase/HD superfamily hydrolase
MNPTAAKESRSAPDAAPEPAGGGSADGGPEDRAGRVRAGLDRLPSRLREAVEPFSDRLDAELIARAYQFAEEAHRGQKRASGDSFIVHTTEVARILTELHLDTVSIVAGLIHDTVEDTPRTLEDVRQRFGDEVARVVDGVTKIG